MDTATLTLPTRGGRPLASPELVRDEIGEVRGICEPDCGKCQPWSSNPIWL